MNRHAVGSAYACVPCRNEKRQARRHRDSRRLYYRGMLAAWNEKNGAGIHGTTQSPFKLLPFDGSVAVKSNSLYLHEFNWPEDGLHLDGLKTRVVSAHVMDGGEALTATRAAGFSTVYVSKPSKRDPYATNIELRLAGKPEVELTSASK